MTPIQVGSLILDIALVVFVIWLLFRVRRTETKMDSHRGAQQYDPWFDDHA